MPEALVVGEALVDVVRSAGGDEREHPGGSPANVALGLARLGRPVRLATWFGPDERGALLRAHLQGSGVRLVPGSDGAQRTSTAIADLDASGAAHYTFDLDWQVPPAQTQEDTLVVHAGSIAATLAPGAQDVARLLRQAAQVATISYDPNLRPSIMGSAHDVRPQVEALVAGSDLVKVSDEDLEWLYPGVSPDEVARRWLATGPAVVVVSRGGAASLGLTAHAEVRVASSRVDVVDTVGAGDSYMAALLDAFWDAGLLGAAHREALRATDEAALTAAMHYAAAVAAITVGRAGADPPTRAEVGHASVNHAGPDHAGPDRVGPDPETESR